MTYHVKKRLFVRVTLNIPRIKHLKESTDLSKEPQILLEKALFNKVLEKEV